MKVGEGSGYSYLAFYKSDDSRRHWVCTAQPYTIFVYIKLTNKLLYREQLQQTKEYGDES